MKYVRVPFRQVQSSVYKLKLVKNIFSLKKTRVGDHIHQNKITLETNGLRRIFTNITP